MRSVKKETMDELARVVRKYWATGDTDILALNHRIGRELSEQAFGSDKKWLQFCDILDGVICLNRNVSNDTIYKIFLLLGINVSAPVEAGAVALTTLMEEGEKSVMSTDYLNPHRIYPDDISRRIDTPPGFDTAQQVSANLSEKPAQNSPKCGAGYRQQPDESSTICRENYTQFGTKWSV